MGPELMPWALEAAPLLLMLCVPQRSMCEGLLPRVVLWEMGPGRGPGAVRLFHYG